MSEETPTASAQWEELFAPSGAQVALSAEAESSLAWSAETGGQAAVVEPDHKPLPRSLVALLTGVVVAAVGLSAFVVGQYAVPAAHPGQAAMPARAEQTFVTLLGRDGFVMRTPGQAAAQAQASCAYLARGGTMAGLISGTAANSPGTTRRQAGQVTRDGIDAFCPQYADK
jgi:hypothetical protein